MRAQRRSWVVKNCALTVPKSHKCGLGFILKSPDFVAIENRVFMHLGSRFFMKRNKVHEDSSPMMVESGGDEEEDLKGFFFFFFLLFKNKYKNDEVILIWQIDNSMKNVKYSHIDAIINMIDVISTT